MMTTPTLLLLLLLLPHLVTPIQRCYKSSCTTNTNSTVCVEQCQSDDYYCQAFLTPNIAILGCAPGTTSEETCNLDDNGLVRSCDCSGDLCNTVPNVTTPVENILGIDHQQPDGPAPDINGSSTVCVNYNCPTPGNCFHGYEECDSNYCSSQYTVDQVTGLLVLSRRSCWDVSLPMCHSSSCHINNPISAPSTGFYLCCCNESLCNLNETFTHPTQHSLYGHDECEAFNCTHSCRIVNHQPVCVCPIGMILDSNSTCVDFNECIDNNGGCTGPNSRCVDTIGSFRCECDNGYVLGSDMRTCQENSGLNCVKQTCTSGNCVPLIDDEVCTEKHFCTAVITFHEGEQVGLFQACLSGAHTNCFNSECEARRVEGEDDTYFCCCNTDLCNDNFTVISNETNSSVSSVAMVTSSSAGAVTPTVTTPSLSLSPVGTHVSPTATPVTGNIQLIIALAVIMFFMVVLICIVVVATIAIIRVKKKRHLTVLSPMPYSEVSFVNEELELLNIIGQGRFARVHRAKQSGREIAVKIFSQANASWDREKEIYSTPSFGHPSILGYHGDAHLDKDATTLMVGGMSRHLCHGEDYLGRDTYWLIFDYHSNGSLYDFLQHNIINMERLCNFAESVASGLAYLHGDEHGGATKPPIAHRDLKSKNILVKSNMTCVISDFGLAAKLVPGEPKLDNNGQVGTSRYMAPEVLEASVNFSDESIIRIDIYAFGLIMWEMMNRSKLSNYPVEEYHAPFHDLVSPNPSVMEMKKVVVTKKRRPEIPTGFRVSENYTRLVEMVTECWDADSEARLPANAIVIVLQSFRRLVAPVEMSKESGFMSLRTSGQSLTNSLRAPPASPSCDSSDTLSPSDLKSAGFLPSYSHPRGNLPADNAVAADTNHLANLYDDRPPPYEPRNPASEPRELSNEPRNHQNSSTRLLSFSESTV